MTNKKGFRFEFLDALRGIAILMVMLLHFTERGVESGDSLIHGRLWPVIQHGYLGVQLFFVVSGYCIAAAVYNGLGKGQTWGVFLKRRAHRIFPPYWASMLLVVVMGWGTILVLNTPREIVFPLAPWEWVANFTLLQGPLQAQDSNIVYWSLSIEIQFYGLMAVCLLLGKRLGEYWLLAVSTAAVILNQMHSINLTGWIMNYWLEFACGIAAFYWITGENEIRLTPWGLVGLVGLSAVLGWSDHDSLVLENGRIIPSLKLLFCLASCLVLVATYTRDEALMGQRLSQWLAAAGTISYSLYLTHVPIATRIFNLGERVTGLSGQRWIIYALVSAAVTLCFGGVYFYFCERPWLNTRPAASPSAATGSARDSVDPAPATA